MFPSKNMYDYMTEINRLFPRTSENEIGIRPEMPPSIYNTNVQMQSPIYSTIANHSSSSAESISPDVFPHMSPPAPPTRREYDSSTFQARQTVNETPYAAKRQRPIVGRKILGSADRAIPTFDSPVQLSPVKNIDSEMMAWSECPSISNTPPNRKLYYEQNSSNQNLFYELFPTENRGLQFKTPVKSSPRTPSMYCGTVSPNSTVSVSPSSSVATSFTTPPPPYRRNISSNFGPNSSRMYQDVNAGKICTFCRKNGETPLVFMTHTVKETVGNKNIVTCPILRSHVCATCGASGDDAHTITYCPVLRSSNNGRPLQSTTITLKNTRVKSNGRKRY
ncbi:hypothetical protein evm_005413 [Chilo suppressalis]|nr:hypothetical protein evm_005413 [Chilo suppressalis]